MQFDDVPPRPRREENVIPMINVVFLMLVFFMITAQITPPEPFEVTPPEAQSQEPADADFTLYINAQGQIAYQDQFDEAAMDALELDYVRFCADLGCAGAQERPVLVLRADGQTPARIIPGVLQDLARRQIDQADLITRVGGGGAAEEGQE